MNEMQIVCDRCKLKLALESRVRYCIGETAVSEFIREHADHNFIGLRVVPTNFLCPNRAKDYLRVDSPTAEARVSKAR